MIKHIFLFCVLYCTASYSSFFTNAEWKILSSASHEDPDQEIASLALMVLKGGVNRVNCYVPIDKETRVARCGDYNPGETLLAAYCIFPQKIRVVEWLLDNGAGHLPDDRGHYPIHKTRNSRMLTTLIWKFGKEILFISDPNNKKLVDVIPEDITRSKEQFRKEWFSNMMRLTSRFSLDDLSEAIDEVTKRHNTYIQSLHDFKVIVESYMQQQKEGIVCDLT